MAYNHEEEVNSAFLDLSFGNQSTNKKSNFNQSQNKVWIIVYAKIRVCLSFAFEAIAGKNYETIISHENVFLRARWEISNFSALARNKKKSFKISLSTLDNRRKIIKLKKKDFQICRKKVLISANNGAIECGGSIQFFWKFPLLSP